MRRDFSSCRSRLQKRKFYPCSVYKPVWEIPGGVVEKDESPKQCCQREVGEELGINQEIGHLLVVDYSSEKGEKTESLMFIFYGGTLTLSEIEAIQLNRNELSEFRFFDADALPVEMLSALRKRVLAAWRQVEEGNGVYLENQEQNRLSKVPPLK